MVRGPGLISMCMAMVASVSSRASGGTDHVRYFSWSVPDSTTPPLHGFVIKIRCLLN